MHMPVGTPSSLDGVPLGNLLLMYGASICSQSFV